MAILRHAEEVTGNVSATCRYYGISRQCFHKWRNRFNEFGDEGLRDRSSRPHHSPNGTDHAKAAAKLLESMGVSYDGTDEGRVEMMTRIPMVAFTIT